MSDANRRDIMLAAVGGALAPTFSAAAASAPWNAWKDLLNMLPTSAEMNAARSGRGRPAINMVVQKIEDANSIQVNFDRYGVRITRMPTGPLATPEKLIQDVRVRLNDFFDQTASSFHPYKTDDGDDWSKPGVPPLGCVMQFDIPKYGVHEEGAVVTSSSNLQKWIFTPVTIGLASPGEHPVSGNREFAIAKNGDGSYDMFTRGADRALAGRLDPAEKTVYDGADTLWRSWQSRVVAFINSNGGQATTISPVTHRPTWNEVKSSGVFIR